MSEVRTQGPYVAARVGFKTTTLQTQGTELTIFISFCLFNYEKDRTLAVTAATGVLVTN